MTDPPLVDIIDPTAGAILDQYLSDLATVVERARRGEFKEAEALKTY